MRNFAVGILLVSVAAISVAATRDNDDTCDVAVTPAATLLLPYFEVDLDAPAQSAATTLFSITNVAAAPQIASVTIWTDFAYPLYTFDIALTGYDVQSVNLRDVLVSGVVPATNPLCAPANGHLPSSVLADLRTALTEGKTATCATAAQRIGATHQHAIGYVTIDVVATCAPTLPATEAYYTQELLYDNVLIGDYAYVDPSNNLAGATPMVHIRAIPEGGSVGEVIATNLPFTFYDRYTPASNKKIDRRQPLPSVFAARFVQGGTGTLNTNFILWREGVTGSDAPCERSIDNFDMWISETTRFDMRENVTANSGGCPFVDTCRPAGFPPASSSPSTSAVFPPLTSGDVAGWMYFNAHDMLRHTRQTQNWLVLFMFAEGRYAALFDAIPLGNGCSPPAGVPTSSPFANSNPIGPRPNVTP